jgi:hypothetical protein
MKPPVLRFAEWTGKGRWWRTPRRSGQAAAVITHHSVTPVTDNPIGDAQTVENVIYARRFSSGFSSIPYGWLIHPDGTILEGRGINYRNAANRSTRSGVTLSNRNTVSVCLIGDYRHRDVTEAQRRAFQSLVTYLADLNVIGNASSISPHSALSRTVCDAGAYKQLSAGPFPNPNTEDDEMQTLISTTSGEAWAVAAGKARKIQDVNQWLATYDGPVQRADNMEHVVADLFQLVD